MAEDLIYRWGWPHICSNSLACLSNAGIVGRYNQALLALIFVCFTKLGLVLIKKENLHKPVTVVQGCNLITQESEAGGLEIQGQPGLLNSTNKITNKPQIEWKNESKIKQK